MKPWNAYERECVKRLDRFKEVIKRLKKREKNNKGNSSTRRIITRSIPIIVRFLLAVVLLFFVWKNSHWSVALLLSLAAVSIEQLTYSQKKLQEWCSNDNTL